MKLLHASDLHLDSPLSRLDAEQAMARRRELRELPARLAEAARREGAELVLLPGDLFDGERVYPETMAALTAALGSLDVPVVIAPGNHDPADGRSPYLTAQWPENVHIFTQPEMACFAFPALNCVVHGCAFTAPLREDEPLAGFSAPQDGMMHLLCLHGEVGLAGRYGPIPPETLARSGAAYAALGHIHACSGLQQAGGTAWAYCGCPEGRGFDECGEKGALLVELAPGAAPTARFLPLSRRQYRIVETDWTEFDRALAALPAEDLVRIVLTGACGRAPDLAALTRQAEACCFYAEVRDATTLPADLWARAEEDDLTGLFLREMRRRLDAADPADRPNILLAARFGLAALEGGEDVCP